jgi:TetR/AcrR family transcriptional regulator, cholesterol catabolism regulator
MSRPSKRARASEEGVAGDLRPKILELAKESFAKRGYIGTSLRDLAERAGVTAAALYYHFEKKEDLLREIIFEGLERIAQEVVAALATSLPAEQALESVVRAHLRYNVECSREAKIIIEDSRFLNEVDYATVREKQNAILNVYRACIKELCASGRIGHVDPTITAFNVVSIILGWYRWFRASGPVTQVDAFEYTVRFAMAAVLNVHPGTTPR